mgnify:CR=1 FL=1
MSSANIPEAATPFDPATLRDDHRGTSSPFHGWAAGSIGQHLRDGRAYHLDGALYDTADGHPYSVDVFRAFGKHPPAKQQEAVDAFEAARVIISDARRPR